MQKSIQITILIFAVPCFAFSQKSSLWFTLNYPIALTRKLDWLQDAGFRTLEFKPAANQYYYRTGIRMKFRENMQAALGVARFVTRLQPDIRESGFGNENRIWQEVTLKQALPKPVSFQYRFRTEERFFQASANKKAARALRLRGRLAATWVFCNQWELTLADEIMFQQQYAFQYIQNRLSLVTAIPLFGGFKCLTGYMLAHQVTGITHIILLTIQHTESHANSK